MIPSAIFLICLVWVSIDARRNLVRSGTSSMNGIVKRDHFGQPCVIDGGLPTRPRQESGDIDGPERAGFIGEKRLLAARIGCLNRAEMRRGIRLVDGVEEQGARFP
jgi:hypothetical protein